MAIVYHSQVARGSSSHATRSAPDDRRYIGKYYWCAYWCFWDKIIDISPNGAWTVQTVDLDGNPLPGEAGQPRTHRTAIEACHIADFPFLVKSRYAADAIVR